VLPPHVLVAVHPGVSDDFLTRDRDKM